MQRIGFLICLLMMLFAFAIKSKRVVVFTDKAPKPIGPYSQAIKTEESLFVSGQIAIKPDGNMDTLNIESECRQVMENIKAIVEAGGYKMNQVVKTTIYTTDLKKFNQINEVYKTYFTADPPARETVQVSALPKGAHLEISVMVQE